jgi:transcription initiation factor IIE alpha subunit
MKLKEVKEKAKICGPAQASHLNRLLVRHYEDKFYVLIDTLNKYLDDTMAVEGDQVCVVCGSTLEYSDAGDVRQCNDVDCLRVMILNTVLDAEEVEGI